MKKLILATLTFIAASAQAESTLVYKGINLDGTSCSVALTFNAGTVTRIELDGKFSINMSGSGAQGTLEMNGSRTFDESSYPRFAPTREGEVGLPGFKVNLIHSRPGRLNTIQFDQDSRDLRYTSSGLDAQRRVRIATEFNCKRMQYRRLLSSHITCDAFENQAMRNICQSGIQGLPPVIPPAQGQPAAR